MNESAKTEMRNYLSAAGFLVIGLDFLLLLSFRAAGTETFLARFALSLLLIITGVLLVVLHKRDLTAILFLMIGMFETFFSVFFQTNLSLGVLPSPLLSGVIGGVYLIFAAIILTAHDPKKYLLAVLPLLQCLHNVLVAAGLDIHGPVVIAITAIIAVLCIFYALVFAAERVRLPFADVLRADAAMDFKSGGSVLGYLLFAIPALYYGLYYGTAGSFGYSSAVSLEFFSGIMMVLAGILLFTIAEMRFTPVMFMIMGIMAVLAGVVPVESFWVPGVGSLVLAGVAALRTESRVLPAVMIAVYGFSYLFAWFFAGNPGVPVLQGLLNFIPAAIAVYLAFAVFSQRKLPLF